MAALIRVLAVGCCLGITAPLLPALVEDARAFLFPWHPVLLTLGFLGEPEGEARS